MKTKKLNTISLVLLVSNLVLLALYDDNPNMLKLLHWTGISLFILFTVTGILENISILKNEPNFKTFVRINFGPRMPATTHGMAIFWLVAYIVLFIIIATLVLVPACGGTI